MVNFTIFKSFGASIITGTMTELLKLLLIYNNFNLDTILIVSTLFGYFIAYIAQRYVFNGGRFFGLSLFKFIAVSLISLQLSRKILEIINNNNNIKNLLENPNISENTKKTYKYIILNSSILIIFICIDYPLRKNFIFKKNKPYDYYYGYTLYLLAFLLYIIKKNNL